jgi:UPF0271 protein
MHYRVDVNCDMGESFGAYALGIDQEVIKYITSSNIACGFHASDPDVMAKTVELCKKHNVMAGAHPGYPDLLGFGRRFMEIGEEELLHYVIYQVGALKGFLDYFGLPLQHVKLHGALYNHLVNEERLSITIASVIKNTFGDVIFLTLGTKRTSKLKAICREQGIRLARKHKEAVLKDHEEIAHRATRMVKEKGVPSIHGEWIEMDIDTLCIHGDNAESIEAAKMIHDYAAREGIEIQPLCKIV